MNTLRLYILLGLLCFCSCFRSAAQPAEGTAYERQEWDFGVIYEEDGVVKHIFRLTNGTGNTLALGRAIAECGCLNPRYSRAPVAPGKEYEVEVAFDPVNFKGGVAKRVTITGNGGVSLAELTVRATVIPRERTVEELYPFSLAEGVRCDRMYLPFGYVQNGSGASMVVRLFNDTDSAAAVSYSPLAADSRLKIRLPVSLPPRSEGEMLVTLDLTSDSGMYGILNEKIYVVADGVEASVPITAMGVAVDDFSEQESRGAECAVWPGEIFIDNARNGESYIRQVTVTNSGIRPLIIRHVECGANISSDIAAGTVIEPGKSVTAEVTLTVSEISSDRAYGTVTIISNDSVNPMHTVKAAASVVSD